MDFNQPGYSQAGSPYARQLREGFAWLRFEPALEHEFRERVQVPMSVRRGRVACLIAILLLLVLFAVDLFAAAPGNDGVLNTLRLGVMLPATLLGLLSTLHPDLRRHYDRLCAAGAMVFGVALAYAVVHSTLHGMPYLFSGLIMLTVYAYLFLGLLVPTAVGVNALTLLAFAGFGFALNMPDAAFYYQLALLITASIICAIAAYTLDHAVRTSFLESRLLQQLAERDGLTGLYNRRMFDDYMTRIWAQARRDQAQLQIVLIDIDHFKVFNDVYGHQAGDDGLRRVADTLSRAAQRPFDLCARYGGEEFVLVLYDAPREFADELPERLRREVAELGIAHGGSEVADTVTVSLGAARLVPCAERSLEGAIELADEALYESKARGRNTVTVRDAADSPVITGSFRLRRGGTTRAA